LVIRVTAIIYVIETGNGGYAAIIEWPQVFVPQLITELFKRDLSSRWPTTSEHYLVIYVLRW
jgi:hypothetical protein